MERDDIIEYSLDAGHSEEEGRSIRKKILFVTILLSVITTFEVLLGVFWRTWMPGSWHWVKWTFIVHLGESHVHRDVLHALGRRA